ncbi:hypothetical protein SNE40_016984 [Patella caerulea]
MPTDGFRGRLQLINQLTRSRTIASPAAPVKPPPRTPAPVYQPPNRSTNWAPARAFPPQNKPTPWKPAPAYPRQNKPTQWAPAPAFTTPNRPQPRVPAYVLPPQNKPTPWIPPPVYSPANRQRQWAPAPIFPPQPPLKPLPIEPEEETTPPPPPTPPAAAAAISLANYSAMGEETLTKLNVQLSNLRNQAMSQIELIPVVDVLEDVLPLIEDFLIELGDSIIKFQEILPPSVTPDLNTAKLPAVFRRILGSGVKHQQGVQYNWI